MFMRTSVVWYLYSVFLRVRWLGRRKLEPVAIVVLAVIMSFVSVQVIQESIQKIVIYLTHVYDDELASVGNWLRNARTVEANSSSSCGLTDDGCALNLSSTVHLVADLQNTLDTCARQHGAPVFEAPTIAICVITIGE
jgi:predicted PurR-regulated permease PerM